MLRATAVATLVFLLFATSLAATGSCDGSDLAHSVDRIDALTKKSTNLQIAYCNRGMAEAEISRLDQALAHFKTANEVQQNLRRCYSAEQNLYLMLGKNQKAVSDYTVVLGEGASDAVVLSRRAQAYEASGGLNASSTTTTPLFGPTSFTQRSRGHRALSYAIGWW